MQTRTQDTIRFSPLILTGCIRVEDPDIHRNMTGIGSMALDKSLILGKRFLLQPCPNFTLGESCSQGHLATFSSLEQGAALVCDKPL